MKKPDDTVWILITRNLSGDATADERKKLRMWLSESPDHREFYRGIASTWRDDPGESADASFLFDYDSGLDMLRRKIRKKKPVPGKRRTRKPGPSGIHAWKTAAFIVLLLVVSSVYVTVKYWEKPAPVSYATSSVEQRIITLSDGSVVRLNRDSRVEIMNSFSGNTRELHLEGEAFFDVTENPERPFIIHVGEAEVRVLGTTFNIKEGEELMVAVNEGLVSLRHRNLDERSVARLAAGQLGLLSKDGHEVRVEQTNVENYSSWMNGYLRFDSMPFGQVLHQLERIYGIECTMEDPDFDSLQLTVYTKRMQMEEVLETIALAVNLTFEKQGNIVKWMKKESGEK